MRKRCQVLEKCKHGNNYIQRKCLLFFSLEGREKKQLKKQQLKQQTATQNFGLFFSFFFIVIFCSTLIINAFLMCWIPLTVHVGGSKHYTWNVTAIHITYVALSLILPASTQTHVYTRTHTGTCTHTHARAHTHTILQPLTSLRIISGNSMRTAYIHKCCDCACVSCDRKI